MIRTTEREDWGEEGFASSRRKEESYCLSYYLWLKKNVPTNFKKKNSCSIQGKYIPQLN